MDLDETRVRSTVERCAAGIGDLAEKLHPIDEPAFWERLAELCSVRAAETRERNDRDGVPER